MSTKFRNLISIFAMLASLLSGTVNYTPARAVGITLFVKPTGGTGGCLSWLSACSLQTALNIANGDEIWAMEGTYIPDALDRTKSFTLKSGVTIYGGFKGTEFDPSQRDPSANVTILSGDLKGDDIGFTNNGENSYHVVKADSNTDSSAILDGFTIRGGNANGSGNDNRGAGMLNLGGSPTLRNVTFLANTASSLGGGMHSLNGSPTLTDVTFQQNSANLGGGIRAEGGNPILTDVIFLNNTAGEGGGMYNVDNSPVVTNAVFAGNSAGAGGGIKNWVSSPMLINVTFSGNSAYHGGGMQSVYSNSPTLRNVTFSGNTAQEWGGGMLNQLGSNSTLTNVTFWGNSATYGGGMYSNANSNPTLTNTIIAGSPTGGDCIIVAGTINAASSNNLIKDPGSACGLTNNDASHNIIGVDPKLGPLGDNGGLTQTHALLADSPAINAGTNTNCPDTDQRGLARPQGGVCDIGAFEFPLLTISGTTAPNVTLSYFDGTPKTVTSQQNGNYFIALPLGWSGTVTPSKPGYTFTPPNRSYSSVFTNQTAQNYTANPITFAITGNAGAGGATLSYNNGSLQTAQSQPNGNYSLTVPWNWSGTVTPTHPCFTFTPGSKNYSNVTANQPGENYSAALKSTCAEVAIKIRETTRGTYVLPGNSGQRLSYSVDSGPVFVNSTGKNNVRFVASERVIYPKGSNTPSHFSEMMGLPAQLKSTRYSFPAYDNIAFNSQLRFANVGTANTTVTVTVGGVVKGNYPLSPNQSTRIGYAGLSSGPVVVQSSGNVPIIASLRVVPLTLNGSYSEIIGVPQNLVSNTYIFPWYNNVNLDTQLRVGNLGPGTNNVTVTVGGVNVGSFTIPLNGSQRINFANVNGGPMIVTSSAPIVASLRVAFRSGATWTGFSEIMGLPQSQLDTTYTFPWYNNAGLDTQLRFANMSTSEATINVYIGGTLRTPTPITLAAGASTRKSFPNVNGGPVKIVSTQNIVASVRIIYPKGSNSPTFFSELMGLPQKQLQAATGYIFPWYNNVGLDTQLRIGVP